MFHISWETRRVGPYKSTNVSLEINIGLLYTRIDFTKKRAQYCRAI